MLENKKVLILEEDPELSRDLVEALDGSGFDTRIVSSDEKLCANLAGNGIDLVVISVGADPGGGMETAAVIRKDYPATACILITDQDLEGAVKKQLNGTVFCTLKKPVHADNLLAVCNLAVAVVRNEERARRSELRNSAITESLLDLVLEVDREGRILLARGSQDGDFDPASYPGKGLDLVFPEHICSKLTEGIKFVRKNNVPWRGAFKLDSPSGEKTVSANLTDNGAGQVLILIRDVTLEKEIATLAEKRRLYLEGVLKYTPDAIITLDKDHRILEWNQGAENIFGFKKGEVVGKDLDDIIAPEKKKESEEAKGLTMDVLQGKSVPPHDTIRYHKDGSPLNVIVSGAPIEIDNSLVGVVATYTNITERVRIQQALSESEGLYRSFLNNFNGIFYKGRIGFSFDFIHGNVEEITGYTEEELLAENPRWIDLIHSDDRGKILTGEEILESPVLSFEREYRICNKNGMVIWLHEVVQSIRDEEKEGIYLQGMMRDITEQKSLQSILDWQQRVNRDVAELSHKIIEGAPIEDISEMVLNKAKQLTGSTIGIVGHIHPGTDELGFLTFSEEVWEYYQPEERKEFISCYRGIWLDVLSSREPHFVNTSSDDEAYLESFTGKIPVWSLLSAPVMLDNQIEGFIAMLNPREEYISRDLQLVMYLADIYAIALSRRETEQKLRYLATHDDLTNLPNRTYFNTTINQALAQVSSEEVCLAVMLLDLNGFKAVNDTYGHDNGDLVLKETARRLRASLRKSDTIARWGGDEFVIIVDTDMNQVGAQVVVEKLLDSFQDEIQIVGGKVKIDTSIGISLYPQDGQDVDSLIRCADLAMYNAKQNKSSYCYFRDLPEEEQKVSG